jgi:integrase
LYRGLRHGAASLTLAAGVDLKVVAERLGHCSIVLTADRDEGLCLRGCPAAYSVA